MKDKATKFPPGIRILTVANMYPSQSDKAYGTFVRNFHEELSGRNSGGVNDLCVIRGRRKGKLAKLKAYAVFYSSLLWKLLARKYDLVYVHTITFPIIPVRLALALRRIPVVFNIHGDDVLPSNTLKKCLKSLAATPLRKARMIVSPSEYFKKVLLEEFPFIPEEKVFVSPSGGIDRRFYVQESRQGASDGPGTSFPVQQDMEIPVIGYVSRLSPGKGWDIYLDALRRLREEGVMFRALMAGGGEQTSQMERMAREAELTGLLDNRGALSQQELPAVYALMDVFVFPTVRRAESLGLVGLEALATGTPVIASDMAGPAGYIRPGVNGYLFKPGDSAGLARRIKEFIGLNPEARRKMREDARRSALPFEASGVADRLCEKLRELLSKQSLE